MSVDERRDGETDPGEGRRVHVSADEGRTGPDAGERRTETDPGERRADGGFLARFRLRRPQVAVAVVPGELRVVVAGANGTLTPRSRIVAELEPGAVRPGLRPGNLADPEALADLLRRRLEEEGELGIKPELVSLVVPDAVVRVALVPVEGEPPGRGEAASMARWALRELLPVEPDDARIDWALLGADDGPSFMLVLGAHRDVIHEYESVVAPLGWTPGRVIPFTLALATEAPDVEREGARLVLSADAGRLACLVESAGVPRLHRAWRGESLPDPETELPPLEQYVRERLDLPVVEVLLSGPESWRKATTPACEALGWRVLERSAWDGLMGALEP